MTMPQTPPNSGDTIPGPAAGPGTALYVARLRRRPPTLLRAGRRQHNPFDVGVLHCYRRGEIDYFSGLAHHCVQCVCSRGHAREFEGVGLLIPRTGPILDWAIQRREQSRPDARPDVATDVPGDLVPPGLRATEIQSASPRRVQLRSPWRIVYPFCRDRSVLDKLFRRPHISRGMLLRPRDNSGLLPTR